MRGLSRETVKAAIEKRRKKEEILLPSREALVYHVLYGLYGTSDFQTS